MLIGNQTVTPLPRHAQITCQQGTLAACSQAFVLTCVSEQLLLLEWHHMFRLFAVASVIGDGILRLPKAAKYTTAKFCCQVSLQVTVH